MKVDIVIPVLNEERILETSVITLDKFMKKNLKGYKYRIFIMDNGSTDKTRVIAENLRKKMKTVDWMSIPVRGRGLALKTAWWNSDADIMSYMDVDLSTDINAFPSMVKMIASKKYDIGIATRFGKKSLVKRSFLRELLSQGYILMVKTLLFVKFSDAQCGFKAVSRRAVRNLLPRVKDNEWFFDTELLTIAEKKGYKIFEIPVKWVEDTDSRVRIFKTVYQYVRDLTSLRLRLWFKGV